MCGIVGILSTKNNCVNNILNGLRQLENRGYDSAGIGCIINNNFIIKKYASDNESALNKLAEMKYIFEDANIGIGHTRWATHGEKNSNNSHPHISSDKLFLIVHNGIIENYLDLKNMLIESGYTHKTDTDSEVIANLLSYNYNNIDNVDINIDEKIIQTIEKTVQMLEGTWSLCIMCIDDPNSLYCTKNGSPLLVGFSETHVMSVSEQSAFKDDITNYIILDNYDICHLKRLDNKIEIHTNHNYVPKQKQNSYYNANINLELFKHWTLKEIYEQCDTITRVISFGERMLLDNSIKLDCLDKYKTELMGIENLLLLGCGTSYNAGMCGIKYFKELCNFNVVYVIDGADFNINDVPKIGKTALILLSQSGETKDLYRCINIAKQHKLLTIGVINVVDSLISREVDCVCYLNAGKEVGVASTKSFTSQCVLLSLLALWFSQNKYYKITTNGIVQNYIDDLTNLQNDVINLLQNLEKNIDKIIHIFDNKTSCFVLGRGDCESIAKEGSLKIKEISYIHSEAYSTSSLKHGPFALLCDTFPVILIAPNDDYLNKSLNAYNEIKSRHAPIIVITHKEVMQLSDENTLHIPYNKTYNNLLSAIVLQMIAYKLSINREINPDMPKNLAKVVTVE